MTGIGRLARAWLATVAVGLLLVVGAGQQQAEAQAIRSNAGFGTSVLAANDDGSVGPVALPFSIDFFGLIFTALWVNNNGNVTFDGPLHTYTPFDLTSTGSQILAPFFADVDTRGFGSGVVTYGDDSVGGRPAFGVNWIDVGYYNQQVDKLNSFQLVMIDRSDIVAGDIDIEFNYDSIQWETGGASGGSGGLGGSSARAGFSNGSGVPGTFLELNGSAVNGAFLDTNPITGLALNSNVGVAGRYLFEVRNGIIEVCGDGIVGGAEECDDGNTIDGDCCSSTCQYEAAGSSCDDGDQCTDTDTCDGSGVCVPAGTLDCDDGSLCTSDSCDSSIGCVNDATPPTCSQSFSKALLILNEKSSGKEKLIVKLLKGAATSQADFGDPTAIDGTAYELCLYSGSLVGSLWIDRAGENCDAKPCWKSVGGVTPTGKGFAYNDKSATADGVRIMKFKAGGEGKTKILIKGRNDASKGSTYLPTGIAGAMVGASEATVQLHSSEGACYAADLLDVKKATSKFFKAK